MKNRFIIFSVVLLVAGCNRKPGGAGGPQGGGGMPPIQVVAVDAILQPVTESLSLVGSITPKEMVEIKSETDGIVQNINFKEGERVESGRLLVKLDETKLAATLAQSEENLKMSEANFNRSKPLFDENLN